MISILLHIGRMSYSSRQLGILLVGAGLFLWGLNVQRKYEGFQIANSAMTPPTTPATSLSDSEHKILSTSLSTKLIDIKTKYQQIVNIKQSADSKLLKFTSDSDVMLKINTLFLDIKDFINSVRDVSYDTITSPEKKDLLLRLYNTTSDKVNILYKIYYTIPSITIGTNVAVNPDNAINLSIVDESVISKSIPMIKSEVTAIPSISDAMPEIMVLLESRIGGIQDPPSDESINLVQESLTKLLTYAEILIKDFDSKTESLAANKMSSKALTLTNNKVLFLKQIITTLETIINRLKTVKGTNSSTVNTFSTTVSTTLTNYNMILKSTQRIIDTYSQMVPKNSLESFQSYMNPYNEESHVLKQAQEFRLKKGSYLNDIFSSIRM